MDEKQGLPPYSDNPPLYPDQHDSFAARARKLGIRRSKGLKWFTIAFLAVITLTQWDQIWRQEVQTPRLDIAQLRQDFDTCKKLQHNPQDPIGLGREKNDRYLGGPPILIKNATIWVGEPVKGTSADDARAGKGWEWVSGDILLSHGLIQKVEQDISLSSVSDDTVIYNAAGHILTAGIIDMHSHMGGDSLPNLGGAQDINEVGDNITPWARSIDGILPFDPQIQHIKSGGITTSLVLPGSGNNIGGEAFLLKHAVGKPDGREEYAVRDMIADPAQNWRYMKMACGENAKRVHGKIGHLPTSRLGEAYEFRRTFEQTRKYIRSQDDWCTKAEAIGVENMKEYLPQEIQWETIGAALRGQVHINVHCYTLPDLEAMVGHTNEFEFAVRAFHHAHQTFLVPDILKRTWGGRPPASALFATNGLYKTEAYIDSEHAGKYLFDANLTTVYVSDNPVLNAQHLVFEAAKGYHHGLPYHAALSAVTTAPAELLGMGERLGKVKPGFDADVVLWDSDPLSLGAAPLQVWIDGVIQFDHPVELSKSKTGPMKHDQSLQEFIEHPTEFPDVIFTGVTHVLLPGYKSTNSGNKPVNVAVSKGKISCIGACEAEMRQATKSHTTKIMALEDGHLTKSFVGVAGKLGLNEIENEAVTDNGRNPHTFSRGVDGLVLANKKLEVAHRHGVTRAISAPRHSAATSNHGTSVGFFTKAQTALEDGAVFARDLAVHYTLDGTIHDAERSYSAAFGDLRHKLIKAVTSTEPIIDAYSEEAYLKQVIAGERVLALSIHSADGISTALRIKSEVEDLLLSIPATKASGKIKLAILGAGEAYLVAAELAAASVGVILAPVFNEGEHWDSRRILSGAPLTQGTGIDYLLDAGVKVAIGLEEDWEIRDLLFYAGIAYRNGEGRLSQEEALGLITDNVFDILGADEDELKMLEAEGDFVMFEGSPLEIGGKIKGVGSRGSVSLWV